MKKHIRTVAVSLPIMRAALALFMISLMVVTNVSRAEEGTRVRVGDRIGVRTGAHGTDVQVGRGIGVTVDEGGGVGIRVGRFLNLTVPGLIPRHDGPVECACPSDYPFVPVPFTQVRAMDDFWAPRIETNRTETIPFAFKKCEETSRISNFQLAGGLIEGKHEGGYGFNDSDVYKVLEGAAYALMVRPDPELDEYVERIISYIAAAQEEDGYLYTAMTNKALDRVGACKPKMKRWDALHHSHELYNMGHFYEAAAAHYLATGRRTLLDVAEKNAQLLLEVFGPGRLRHPPGHQEIELGLVKLYRVTGKPEYLALAKFFLDIRGRALDGRKIWGPYCQDHMPVVEQDEAVGHAVRATYMFSSMADIAALTGDPAYLTAVDRLWENVVSKKLYITGGVGATGSGEAYGRNYELPNRTAYCETCAAIANVYWNHRMFLLHGKSKYIDVMERTLYNSVISGVSLDGKKFFYPNPLESHGDRERSSWFGCSCCPTNISRFIASVPGYAYATRGDAVFANLYFTGKAVVALPAGKVEIEQKTDYPYSGRITLVVRPERQGKFSLKLRVPGWARNQVVPSDLYRYADALKNTPRWELSVDGAPPSMPVTLDDGYITINRTWTKEETTVVLDLPMPVRRVVAHGAVVADLGRVAIERGPIVYCIEWPDVEGGEVLSLLLPDSEELATRRDEDLLGGVTLVCGTAVRLRSDAEGNVTEEPVTFSAIPYSVWAHRGPGEMMVWIPRERSAATPLPPETIASRSRPSASGGKPAALNDQREPKSSGDHTYAFLHWWPRKGTLEWVQYDFAKSVEVSAVEVYWFDDTGRGACRLPQSWRLFYRDGEAWREVERPGEYGVAGDKYNRAEFTPVTTDALKIEVQLQEDWAGGIHEWRVEGK